MKRLRCGGIRPYARRAAVAIVAAVAGLAPLKQAWAQGADEFFKGRTLRIIVTTTVGGSYDLRSRIMARHYGRLLPGNPNIVVENMPGAGSVVAMNYMYNVAPKDGTVMSMTQRIIFTTPLLTPDGLRFELAKFSWLGNMGADNGLVVAWHTTPIKTTADLFRTEMIVAGTGQTTMPLILNAIIGTKFKMINGYPGAAEMQIAMERGEVMGPGEWSWSDLKTTKQDWIKDKKIVLLLQSGLMKAPDLSDVPLSLDYAKTEADRRVLEVFLSQRQLAYPMLMPPDVPADRVQLMRDAFMALDKDPEFKAEFAKAGLEFQPMHGAEVATLVKRTTELPADLLVRIKSLVEPPK